jgi:hypothetical protein
MIKHYIEYLYPGILFAESSDKEITERKLYSFPEACFAYRFYDIETSEGEHGTLVGPRFNLSGYYYNGGQIYTPAEVEQNFPDEKTLISNVQSFKHAIKTSIGNWQEFTDKDHYILDGKEVI